LISQPNSAVSPSLSLTERRLFLQLPLEERRRRLAEQAARMAPSYEDDQTKNERSEWQNGDIVES